MWKHLLRPHEENINCGLCKIYKHYSWKNPDENKQGKPVIELGKYVKRRNRLNENCSGCPSEKIWTSENAEIYKKWMLARDGFNIGPVDKETLNLFFLLSDAAGDIQRRHLENALAIGLLKIKNG